jgi:glycogen debranching enzyme
MTIDSMTFPSYRYPVDSLSLGCSLGNRLSFARLDALTDLQGLWGSLENLFVLGRWQIEILVNGAAAEAVDTHFAPESQSTIFRSAGVTVWKQFFLPIGAEGDVDPQELQAAIFSFRIKNNGPAVAEVQLRHRVFVPAMNNPLFTKQPPEDETAKRVHIEQQARYAEMRTIGRTEEVRIFGSRLPWRSFQADDRTLQADYVILVPPGGEKESSFTVSFSHQGRESALQCYLQSENAAQILERSRQNLTDILSRCLIHTPEATINRSLLWAKVNMLRVQHEYHIGPAFTNDPPQDIVVLRDLAWYVLGADYLTPQFSRSLLELAKRYSTHQEGKITEYIHANERAPVQHDYNLNINDDTPLLVWALFHHALVCGERGLHETYLNFMTNACDWILRQRTEGLVRCTADGSYVWGICSWRNIIDGYALTGAVTEINAESFMALSLAASAARRLNRLSDAARYEEAAQELKQTMNSRLVSDQTGMYLLNIANDGTRRHDITGDLIFPVICGVAEPRIEDAILKKLTDEDLWTPYGSRTVSSNEPNFDPESGYDLMGGIWPNLTAWIAYGLRGKDPEKLVEAMRNIYRVCEAPRPADFGNIVPGQFPERLHGTTFLSSGMSLSPWMPPTYIWLGVEGLLGINPTFDEVEMNPSVPPEWDWVCIKDLPYRGGKFSAFLYHGVLYTTGNVTSRYPVKVGVELPTESDNDDFLSIGMTIGNDVVLFVASEEGGEGKVSTEFQGRQFIKGIALPESGAALLEFPAAGREKPFRMKEKTP